MIWVNVGSRAPARRSLAPTPVPVRVVVGRVVSIRLAVRVVAAKKETFEAIECGTYMLNILFPQEVWIVSPFAKVSYSQTCCFVGKPPSSVQLNGGKVAKSTCSGSVDSRVKLVNAWIIWWVGDPHLSNVATLS